MNPKVAVLMVLVCVACGEVRSTEDAALKQSKIEKDSMKSMVSTEQNLSRQIESKLPNGWLLEKKGNRIIVKKEDPVIALRLVPSMNMMAKAKPTSFSFILSQVDYIEPTQFAKLKEHNSDLKRDAVLIYEESEIREIPHTIDKVPEWKYEYQPRTPEESKAVAKYKSLHSKIVELPSFYDDNHSYFLHLPTFEFERMSERNECLRILINVLELLNKYEDDSSMYVDRIRSQKGSR